MPARLPRRRTLRSSGGTGVRTVDPAPSRIRRGGGEQRAGHGPVRPAGAGSSGRARAGRRPRAPSASRIGAATDLIPTAYSSTVQAKPSARTRATRRRSSAARVMVCSVNRSSPPAQYARDRGVGPRREQHQPARHHVQRQLLTGPVLQRHVLVGVDLVEVEHRPVVGRTEIPAVSPTSATQHLEVRHGPGRRVPTAGSTAAARSRSVGPMRYVGPGSSRVTAPERLERAEQARGRAHRETGAPRDVADPAGAGRDRAQDRERAVDRLHAGHDHRRDPPASVR